MPRTAKTIEELQFFLSETLNTSSFRIQRASFDAQEEWLIKDGMLSHRTGGFFHVIGVNDAKADSDTLYLFQPQSALTGLIICPSKNSRDPYVLTQARIEPGNTGVIQLGPTIQSTPANFLRLHNGKKNPYLDYLYSGHHYVTGFHSTNQLDLGKRYYQKTKWHNFALVSSLLETADTYIWLPLSVLAEAVKMDFILNTDLRSLIAIFNWDSLSGQSAQPKQNQSSAILEYYLRKSQPVYCRNKFIPIDQSSAFSMEDQAIRINKNDQEVGLYQIETNHREVQRWTQPLWSAEGKGKAILLCSDLSGQRVFLLTVEEEKGTASSFSISTSFLFYPEDTHAPEIDSLPPPLARFAQSDEGGRFINHEFEFQLIEVDYGFPIRQNQFWVGIDELIRILSTSNLCNIQLRGICSLLIEQLNPLTFET
ncbi:NDP-hexose 2,3-dehydratase family protein [Phaeodactylibacter sp.]|uniref:NDP-hexose 2,3-dehydratase family protein n=1 Tax=Phaeodactylibacter sp. TaxID=1940289 RepID=UPI0025D514C1|nr:NDP-hexose 2,3-dehydratase family protein [Phaeodactylibacter sp.]MCI4648289.1 NDP-hexose 2,3-dehydratase family protein [Phaeodactylibacter sp.]MCI5091856.1 NDP-hexose 2,3-dehydratase family protein [Phaeodactylibacter sp.]